MKHTVLFRNIKHNESYLHIHENKENPMKNTTQNYDEIYKKESEMFNLAADYYDQFRPSYPAELVQTFTHKTGITKGSELLEIGAGSGKATQLFKDKGFHICCIDPGKDLVDKGILNFQNYPNIKFECSRFEDYNTPDRFYDVIFAAQAFHWVPQPAGFIKCAAALKEKGFLAPFWNMYITYDNDLDHELCEISKRYGGLADFLDEEGCEKRISTITASIYDSGLFHKPEVFRFLWRQTYTADEYYGFALTGNSFIQKSEEEKQKAYKDIVCLADKHGGVIDRPYLCVLYLAQKL